MQIGWGQQQVMIISSESQIPPPFQRSMRTQKVNCCGKSCKNSKNLKNDQNHPNYRQPDDFIHDDEEFYIDEGEQNLAYTKFNIVPCPNYTHLNMLTNPSDPLDYANNRIICHQDPLSTICPGFSR